MAAGDTPLSTAAAFAARAEKTGSATMILGVGNNKCVVRSPCVRASCRAALHADNLPPRRARSSAPVQQDTLGGISKIEKAARGKGKPVVSPGPSGAARNGRSTSQGPASVISDIPMRTLPLPQGQGQGRGASGTPEPGAPRRGFAPVRSFSPATGAGSGGGEEGGTPGPSGGAKLSIAVKRKAGDEGEGSPASKRRG